jgi:NhaA family Na+:H+ antiporter
MKMIREFFKYEAAGGIFLGIAAILALIMENSSLASWYDQLITTTAIIQIGNFIINKPILLWINDGLMAIFFLLVSLEIKREIIEGQLSTSKQAMLPLIAAMGGVIIPAIIYSYINWGDAIAMRGWAIPAATDIAFALGTMSLLGNKIPETLKLCLITIAIVDDLAAIIIIAVFYTANLSVLSLILAILAIVMLIALNKNNVMTITPYVLVGIVLWICVLKSGVHATLAGVLLGFCIPLGGKKQISLSPLRSLEHALHPWVAYIILPIFAFANAGVPLHGFSWDLLLQPITLGIIAGLFIGKQLGVVMFTMVGLKTNLCKLPKNVSWLQYYGMSLLTGVGFTMSLFIGTLAFDDLNNQNFVRLGVLVGSLLSGILGYTLLALTTKKK